MSENENAQTGVIVAKPKRVRRVGSITMGISLIATGVVSIICLIDSSFDAMKIARFFPAMLILLGIEFLGANFAKEQEYVKYDFFSIFMCFMLICAVLAMTAGLMTFQYYMKINVS